MIQHLINLAVIKFSKWYIGCPVYIIEESAFINIPPSACIGYVTEIIDRDDGTIFIKILSDELMYKTFFLPIRRIRLLSKRTIKEDYGYKERWITLNPRHFKKILKKMFNDFKKANQRHVMMEQYISYAEQKRKKGTRMVLV